MPIIVIIIVALFIFSLIIHVLLIRFGTHIGEKGHRNVLLQNLFSIIEAFLVLIISWLWIMNYGSSGNRIYAIFTIIIGLILLVSGIIGIKGILRESPEDLVTESLSDIRITPAGYHNQDRKLEGMANGTHSWFMLRGADKALAKSIKESGQDHVTVVYHSSNRRIESIYL